MTRQVVFFGLIFLLFAGLWAGAPTAKGAPVTGLAAGGATQPPLEPVQSFGTMVLDYAAAGDYAYVLAEGVVRVLSFAEPGDARVVGEIFSHARMVQVELSGDGSRLLVRTEQAGRGALLLYDVSDPSAPRYLGATQSINGEITVYGERIYSHTGNVPGVRALTLHSLAGDQFTRLGSVPDDTYGEIIEDGSRVVVAPFTGFNRHEFIGVFDVSDPTAPRQSGTVPSVGGIAVPVDGFLYVSRSWDIWDIRGEPLWLADGGMGDIPLARRDKRLLYRGGFQHTNGLSLYDVTAPLEPALVGAHDFNSELPFGEVAWTRDHELFVRQRRSESSLLIDAIAQYTVAPPFALTERARYELPRYDWAIPVSGRYLYLSLTGRTGVDIYDISAPNQPRYRATALEPYSFSPSDQSFVQMGDRLYIRTPSGITTVDVSDPIHPTVVAVYPLHGDWSVGGSVEGEVNGYLYAHRRDSADVLRLRLSDMESEMVQLPGVVGCADIEVRGTLLAALCDDIVLFDITDFSTPAEVGRVETEATLYAADLDGTLLVVAASNGISAYDIALPGSPQPLSTPAPGTYQGLAPLGARHYLRYEVRSCDPWCEGLPDGQVVDLSDPSQPLVSEPFLLPQPARPAAPPAVHGRTLYFTNGEVQLWQLRETTLPLQQFLPLAGAR